MSSVAKPADRNVDGILNHMREYLSAREQQAVRMNPHLENVIKDVAWIHLEILRNVLQKSKAFGGEKYRVADVLTGADDAKRKALLSSSGDQSSIMDEIIERPDESGKKAADHSIHDMRSFFRSIDPALGNLVQLIQHWMKWDLADASDQHGFDEQVRRLTALRGIQLTDDLRARYRQALAKPVDEPVSDQEIFEMEMRRLDQIAGRFCGRRSDDEPYQLIICRDEPMGDESAGEPYNYKLRQCQTIARRLEDERTALEARIGNTE
jgi:hypothetical protein